MTQLKLLKKGDTRYGSSLLKTRKGRSAGRPIDSRRSMHLVLRSSKAKGAWSFKRKPNEAKILALLDKFALRYGITIHSSGNVGNHLHLHIKLPNRMAYKPFIRALTGAIAMAVTGVNRWNPGKTKLRFWDYRPFSRVVFGWRDFQGLNSYIQLNQLEGHGVPRDEAEDLIRNDANFVNYELEFGTG